MSKVFQPRPPEIPADLLVQAAQLKGLAELLQKTGWKTLQAFNAKGFTFPHELDIILTDLERKADQLQIYLRAENYTTRLVKEVNAEKY